MPRPHRLRDNAHRREARNGVIEPSELIERLTRQLAAGPGLEPEFRTGADDDPAVVAGRLGLAWLEQYERNGAADALTTGVARLRETVEAEPDHPERAWWVFWLGLGYAELAGRRRSVKEYHRAVEWILAAYSGARPGAEVRSRAVQALVAVLWEQFWLVRLREPGRGPATRAAADRLIVRLAPMLTSVADPEDLPFARMAAGLARLHRYELSGRRPDLDRAIDLFGSASIWEAARGTPLVGQVGSELANAWRQQGLLDNDDAALDRAIGTGRRLLHHEDLGDGPEHRLVLLCLAYAHETRWHAHQRVEDLDGTVDAWRRLIEVDDVTPAEIVTPRRRRRR